MNVCLLFACMTVLPIVTGRGVFAVFYRGQTAKFHIADYLITGWLVTIGLAEVAHLAAAFFGYPISKVAGLWIAGLLLLAVLCVGISWLLEKINQNAFQVQHVRRRQRERKVTPLQFGLFLTFSLSVIWQIVTIVSSESVYWMGDMTAETVESFLQTDKVYAVNPLTGRAYTGGIPLRIKILGLPTLYSILCSVFQVEGTKLVWKYIPLMVLVLSYSAYWLIATALFDRRKETDKCMLFMALVSLLFCVGDYAYGMDGFGILHCGYQGVVIRNMVLIPYIFALTLRRKWIPAGLVVLAEACITWTFYGMGASLFVLAGMAGVWGWRGKRGVRRWQARGLSKKDGGPEVCGK